MNLDTRSSPTPTRPANTLKRCVGRMARLPALRQRRSDEHHKLCRARRTRPGLYKCNDCREQFTVTVGTVFERYKIPLAQVAAGDAPHGVVQEGHVRAPAAPHAGRHLQNRLVHGASHPRSDERGRERRSARRQGKTVEADETYIGKRETPRKLSRSAAPTLPSGQGWRRTEAHRRRPSRAWRQGPHVPS